MDTGKSLTSFYDCFFDGKQRRNTETKYSIMLCWPFCFDAAAPNISSLTFCIYSRTLLARKKSVFAAAKQSDHGRLQNFLPRGVGKRVDPFSCTEGANKKYCDFFRVLYSIEGQILRRPRKLRGRNLYCAKSACDVIILKFKGGNCQVALPLLPRLWVGLQ